MNETGDKPSPHSKAVTCLECRATFSKRGNLKTHIKRKHPAKLNILFPKKTKPSTLCADCNTRFSSSSNLRLHLKRKHPEQLRSNGDSQTVVNCKMCQQSFSSEGNLTAHIRRKHPDAPGFKCERCQKTFGTDSSLKKHLHQHASSSAPHSTSLKCCLCSHLADKNNLRRHYQKTHNIALETATLHFPSPEKFFEWKRKIEEETVARFVNSHGRYETETYTKHIYECHRSGRVRLRGQGKRRMKKKGSNKIDGYCPSCIEMFQMKDVCRVYFTKTHVGHNHDRGRVDPKENQRVPEMGTETPLSIHFLYENGEVHAVEEEGVQQLNATDLENLCKDIDQVEAEGLVEGLSGVDEEGIVEQKQRLIAECTSVIEEATTLVQVETLRTFVDQMRPALEALTKQASFICAQTEAK